MKNSQLLGGDQSIPDFDKSGSFVTGRSGDGAARITLLIPSATMGPTIAASKKFQLRNTCEPLKQKQTLDRPSHHYTLISTLLNEGLSKTLADLFKWQIDK